MNISFIPLHFDSLYWFSGYVFFFQMTNMAVVEQKTTHRSKWNDASMEESWVGNTRAIWTPNIECKSVAEFLKHVQKYPNGYLHDTIDPVANPSWPRGYYWKAIVEGNLAVHADLVSSEAHSVVHITWIMARRYGQGYATAFFTELIRLCTLEKIVVSYAPSTIPGRHLSQTLQRLNLMKALHSDDSYSEVRSVV